MEIRNDVSEIVEIPQDNEIIVVSNVEEDPQYIKRKKIKKIILSIAISLFSLIIITVSGVLIYLNSIGINYIETDNSKENNNNSNNSVLVEDLGEDFEEDIEEIITDANGDFLPEEEIEEILGEDSNIIIGEEFDIIIEDFADILENIDIPDAEVDTPDAEADAPDAGNTAKPNSGNTAKPNSESTTKPNSGSTAKPNSGSTAKPNSGNTAKPNSGSTAKPNSGSTNSKNEEEAIISAVRNNSSLSASLYKWYNNGGAHMASKNILNILIVGIDATGGQRMKGNSDVMMLASINKNSGKIILCSFLRDSYSYYEDANGKGYYKKLTSAYFDGGADCLINAIEKNYKIEIDHFVAVDFEAFKQVIDLIGGVNLNLTKEEAETIKHTLDTTGANKYDVPYGNNVVLNGEQALAYSRIRKLYSSGDIQRTQNQRKVINAIIKKSKTLSLSDLNGVVQQLGKYIYTDCSSTKIVSLGTSALLGKWYDFQIFSMDAPPESARAVYESPTAWLWVVDYPRSAQFVQKQIYGKSNIAVK